MHTEEEHKVSSNASTSSNTGRDRKGVLCHAIKLFILTMLFIFYAFHLFLLLSSSSLSAVLQHYGVVVLVVG